MKKVIAAGAFFALAACATVSQMTPTGGSKADAIVEMSFEYGMFDKVKLDPTSAMTQAKQRCEVWGYESAEPFGGVVKQCQAMSGYGCARWFATMKFQCTGGAAHS